MYLLLECREVRPSNPNYDERKWKLQLLIGPDKTLNCFEIIYDAVREELP